MKTLESRKAEIIEGLMEIKPEVNSMDKAAAKLEYDISDTTQERYLNGQVASVIIGNTLLQFFKKRITDRANTVAIVS